MKSWSLVLLVAASLIAASCGISGHNGGDDPSKSELTINDLAVAPTDSSAVVGWYTTSQTVGTVIWAPVGSAASSPISSAPSGRHSVVIPGLASDTRYWYQVTAATPLGAHVTSLPDTFRTLVNPETNDSTAPVISGVEVTGITASGATIIWHTDDRSIGQVFYGFSATYGSNAADSASYTRNHSLTLTDLSEDEEYNFRVWAKNRAGLTAYSDNLTFNTAERPWMEVYPDTVHVVGNGDFEFGIRLRGARNIAGMTFMLSYDPAVMEIISVRKASWFDQTQGHIFINESEDQSGGRTKWDASWTVIFVNGVSVGTLANGGGEVAHVRARARGAGASSPLRLVDLDLDGDSKPETRLLDHNRRDLLFHVRSGVVIKAM